MPRSARHRFGDFTLRMRWAVICLANTGALAMKSKKPIGVKAKPGTQDRARSSSAISALSQLPTLTTTQLKTQSWNAVIAKVNAVPAMAVTRYHQTDFVILTASKYESLTQQTVASECYTNSGEVLASKDPVLEKIRKEFDQRLAKLNDGKSLDEVTRMPAHQGKIKLGPAF